MTNEEIKQECEKYIGRTFTYDNGLYYRHGRPMMMHITGVKVGLYGVDVLNSLTFEDGSRTADDTYSMFGMAFLEAINNKQITKGSNNE